MHNQPNACTNTCFFHRVQLICLIFPYYTWSVLRPYRTWPSMCTNWRLNGPISEWNVLICGKYQYIDGLTGRLGVGIPPVLDTVSAGCLHNFYT